MSAKDAVVVDTIGKKASAANTRFLRFRQPQLPVLAHQLNRQAQIAKDNGRLPSSGFRDREQQTLDQRRQSMILYIMMRVNLSHRPKPLSPPAKAVWQGFLI
jgi:hypothetical protein